MTETIAASSNTCRPTVGRCLADIRAQLAAVGIESGDQEARWLMEHVLGLSSVSQVIGHDRVLSDGEVTAVRRLVARRVSREPLQYLLGTQEFCGREFVVTPAVLIPRPETEMLVEEVFRRVAVSQQATVVDVCTGSGCIAVSIARQRPLVKMMAADISGDALAVARENASRHAVAGRIEWMQGDLLEPLADKGLEGRIDVIVSNPPYIAEQDWVGLQAEVRQFEPRHALVAGPNGTEFHERLLREAARYFVPGGMLLTEIGAGQAPAVRALIDRVGGYESIQVLPDAAGIERVVIVERSNR